MNKSFAITLFLGIMVLINTVLSPDGHLDRIADAHGVAPAASSRPQTPAEHPVQVAVAVPAIPQPTAAPATSEGSTSLWDLLTSDDADEEVGPSATTSEPTNRPHLARQVVTHVPRSTTEGELSREQLHLEE